MNCSHILLGEYTITLFFAGEFLLLYDRDIDIFTAYLIVLEIGPSRGPILHLIRHKKLYVYVYMYINIYINDFYEGIHSIYWLM